MDVVREEMQRVGATEEDDSPREKEEGLLLKACVTEALYRLCDC